jgi:hypothetical protein
MTETTTGTATIDRDEVLQTALHLGRHEIPVFPCRPGSKIPAIPSAHPSGHPCRGECDQPGHGFLDATTDEATIRAWWTRWPTANLAIPTGAATVDVLDIDVHADGSGFPGFNRLQRAGLIGRACRIVATPSGGLHLYGRGSTQPSGRLPREHIDLKAAGGYILVPPSVVNGRRYEIVQSRGGVPDPIDWPAIRALLDPPPAHRPRRPSDTGPNGIDRLTTWMRDRPEGQRNTGLFWAACTALDEGTDDLTPLLDAAVAAGLTGLEAFRTIASARRRLGTQTNGANQ